MENMNVKNILSKETLLTYLINELSSGNYEVTTHLDNQGCWIGKVTIEISGKEENNDNDYYKALVSHM